MNYNMIEPLHFYSYHEFVIFSSQAKELFPIRGYREKSAFRCPSTVSKARY